MYAISIWIVIPTVHPAYVGLCTRHIRRRPLFLLNLTCVRPQIPICRYLYQGAVVSAQLNATHDHVCFPFDWNSRIPAGPSNAHPKLCHIHNRPPGSCYPPVHSALSDRRRKEPYLTHPRRGRRPHCPTRCMGECKASQTAFLSLFERLFVKICYSWCRMHGHGCIHPGVFQCPGTCSVSISEPIHFMPLFILCTSAHV